MKIGGIDPKTLPNEEILVLPRGDQQIVIRARGISDMTPFEKLCPEPQAPVRFDANGVATANFEDVSYKAMCAEYGKRKIAYIVVTSLEPSAMEWETVNMDAASTWANWEQDLLNGGLNKVEVNRILNLALEANCLDEAKLRKARDLFLQGPLPASAT